MFQNREQKWKLSIKFLEIFKRKNCPVLKKCFDLYPK